MLASLKNAKNLFNCLYAAIVDDWKFDSLSSEVESERLTEDSDIDLEAVAAYLKPAAKKELCAILGRPYLEPKCYVDILPAAI